MTWSTYTLLYYSWTSLSGRYPDIFLCVGWWRCRGVQWSDRQRLLGPIHHKTPTQACLIEGVNSRDMGVEYRKRFGLGRLSSLDRGVNSKETQFLFAVSSLQKQCCQVYRDSVVKSKETQCLFAVVKSKSHLLLFLCGRPL